MRPIKWDSVPIKNGVIRAVEWYNPIVGSPSSSLETVSYLDSFGTSLMPRTSTLQGAAAGLSVIAARLVSNVVETANSLVVPAGAPVAVRLAARATAIGAGRMVARLPEQSDETMWRSTARSSGQLLEAAGSRRGDLGRRDLAPPPFPQ
jgi:hypothetical protein